MGTWADDDVHRCAIQQDSNSSNSGSLYVLGPGSQHRRVASVTGFGPHGGPGVLICDTQDNFALLETVAMGSILALTEVSSSDGATLWGWEQNSSSAPCNFPDVIAEGGVYEGTGGLNGGYVCDLATGQVVARLQGQPLAISWAGHVVIEMLSSPPNSFSLEAIDWQTGSVLWRNQSAAERSGFVPSVQTQDQPNGDAIALTTVPNPPAGSSVGQAELWLIRPGHPAFELSTQAEPGSL